jgi:hypothetical protein
VTLIALDVGEKLAGLEKVVESEDDTDQELEQGLEPEAAQDQDQDQE